MRRSADRKIIPYFVFMLLVFLSVRIFFLFREHVLYWDAAVYIGMAKHIYSAGSIGLWEPIRPLIWPLLLGIPWLMGADVIFSGHVMQIIFSAGIVVLSFLLAKEYENGRAAIFASTLMAFSGFFIFLNYRLLTEIPAAFFAVLAVYLYVKKKPFLAGIFASLSFLTKFPFGIFLPVIVLADFRRFRSWLRYAVGFAIPSSAYLVSNFVLYSNPIFPLLEAARIIKINVGCNITFAQPWHIYLTRLPFDNWLFPFSLLGIFVALKRFRSGLFDRILLLSILLPLAYLMHLSCRDFRFAMMFLPFVAVFAGAGLDRLFNLIMKRSGPISRAFPVFYAFVLVLSLLSGLMAFAAEEPEPWPSGINDYYSFLSSPDKAAAYEGYTVVSSTPWPAAYSDVRLNILYYPNFDSRLASTYSRIFSNSTKMLVFYDNCGGGLECPPSDINCPSERSFLFNVLNSEFEKIEEFSFGACRYVLFVKP